jgi:transcriptional regulator with XRE-family HTH domain
MSRQLGIKSDELAAYEAGENRINASLLLQIANTLEVRPVSFFRPSSEVDAKVA